MEIYVKATSNYPQGLPLSWFELLSPTWESESVIIPFGEEPQYLQVVGWTDLFMGRPCSVKIARVRDRFDEGFLVWGGNSGLRVLDPRREPGWNDKLPPGWGMPIIWVDDPDDLPEEVWTVVAEEKEEPQEPEDIDEHCWPKARIRNPKGTY